MINDYVSKSEYDFFFRKKVTELIRLATKEVLISTGEFSIYYYPDVRHALRDAWRRNISIKAYMGRCDDDTINRAVANGIEVYSGKKPPEEHLLVIDRKHWIKSEDHTPYEPGMRHGHYGIDDEKTAVTKSKMVLSYFEDAIRVKEPKRDKARIERFLQDVYH